MITKLEHKLKYSQNKYITPTDATSYQTVLDHVSKTFQKTYRATVNDDIINQLQAMVYREILEKLYNAAIEHQARKTVGKEIEGILDL
jgi:hypothetical protein